MKKLVSVFSSLLLAVSAFAYDNPIIYADYSDPDVIRVGSDYYMTASSFNCSPGLPILHSCNLVDWEMLSYALPAAIPGGVGGLPVEHGNQVWAPSIRYHNKLFYIVWGDPDTGIWQVHAANAKGPWSEPTLITSANGYIDACPFWDADGRTYIVHALAGSRAGMKSVLLLTETDASLTRIISPSRIIFDGHQTQPTCEGPKLYKKGDYYYIFFPAGGVPTGWQTVLRSKNLYSGWEEKIVMRQGASPINGPHQGGWVTTPSGEDWFIHFQDVGPLGRILHLQPMTWQNDWPVIGADSDGDGVGEPVLSYRNPNVGKSGNRAVAALSDWQWQANPLACWYQLRSAATDVSSATVTTLVNTTLSPKQGRVGEGSVGDGEGSGYSLRLYSYPMQGVNLWLQPNLLLQKITGPDAVYTAQLTFCPTQKYTGERCGLLVFGTSYAGLILENTPAGITLSQVACEKAEKGSPEQVLGMISLPSASLGDNSSVTTNLSGVQNTLSAIVFLQVTIHSEDALAANAAASNAADVNNDKIVTADFSYSLDGTTYLPLGSTFLVKPGKWIGAKVGCFCTRPAIKINDGGWADVLSFEKK